MARRGTFKDTPGYVYLICFNRAIGNPDNPHGQAKHYIGWTDDPPKRIAEHTNGTKKCNGSGRTAAIMAYVQREGIGFEVVWVEPGTLADERRLKNRKNAKYMCGRCVANAGPPAPLTNRVIRQDETTITEAELRQAVDEVNAWAEKQDKEDD